MIFFITYNDHPSGVYWSQVTDVVDHLNELGPDHVRLVAMVSLRRFRASRRNILKRHPKAIVVPMIPRAHQWRANWIWLFLLCLIHRPTGMIGRGIFATALALRMRTRGLVDKVCFDARAAYGAEWREFRVVDDDLLIAECAEVEKEVVREADLRMAVSGALVSHWREVMQYNGQGHEVIPCTLGRDLQKVGGIDRIGLRRELGWGEDDLVLVYSGSTVGWQSVDLMAMVLETVLNRDPTARALFLSQDDEHIRLLKKRFPGRVELRWYPHDRVLPVLACCDIGLLVRNPSITNKVASPTKFAEYLSAGLQVLISEELGDLSPLVRSHGLGWVLGASVPDLKKPTAADRERSMRFAYESYTKSAHDPQYRQLLRCVGPSRVYASSLAQEASAVLPHGLVSVVVPSFNKLRYIEEMVASVQTGSYSDWEMRFVDDASTDGTRELIAELAEKDPRIHLHLLPENRGANHCRNLGVQEAKGDHLLFLDADDVLGPDCIRDRLRIAALGDFDLVVSTMEVFHQNPGDGTNRWVPSARDPLAEFLRHRLPWSVMQPLWKRKFLLELGGFDESFSRHQDVEFHTRALFDPFVKYCTIVDGPDCFYRIDEDRKVLKPYDLLEGFTRSALKYYFKFYEQAARTGRHRLLVGIIYQTHIQLIHYRKLDKISQGEFDRLYTLLMDPAFTERIGTVKRTLLKLSGWYNALPVRIPGVNLVLYRLVTL